MHETVFAYGKMALLMSVTRKDKKTPTDNPLTKTLLRRWKP